MPDVAIFTDGRLFHATVGHNWLAGDAEKRQILRDTGRVVLAVTAADVTAAEKRTPVPPPWYNAKVVEQLLTMQPFMASPAAYERLRGGPIEWLIDWISDSAPKDTTVVARAIAALTSVGAAEVSLPEGEPLATAATSHLLGTSPSLTAGRQVRVWRSGACAIAVEQVGSVMQTVLVLDDRDSVLDAAHADSWREWLRLSNALALRDWPTVITTTSLAAAAEPVNATANTSALAPDIAPEWQPVVAETTSGLERNLVLALADAGLTPTPAIGDEGPDGIPLDVSWPQQQVVVQTPTMTGEDHLQRPAARAQFSFIAASGSPTASPNVAYRRGSSTAKALLPTGSRS